MSDESAKATAAAITAELATEELPTEALAAALRKRVDPKELIVLFRAQLEGLRQRGLLKPKQIEDMVAGFSDGVRSVLWVK